MHATIDLSDMLANSISMADGGRLPENILLMETMPPPKLVGRGYQEKQNQLPL